MVFFRSFWSLERSRKGVDTINSSPMPRRILIPQGFGRNGDVSVEDKNSFSVDFREQALADPLLSFREIFIPCSEKARGDHALILCSQPNP